METILKELGELGYTLVSEDISYIFENKKDDIRVTIDLAVDFINLDDEDAAKETIIFVDSMSEERDWYGCSRRESRGLSIHDYKLFIKFIEAVTK